ncbi:hypothetical protein ABPG72_017289, partial [Tetrahymena utriculariae]
MPNNIETKQTQNNIQEIHKLQTTKNVSSMYCYPTIKSSQLNQNIQDDAQFVPLDQIRQVLMDKGLGQQYYKIDYFAENNNNKTTLNNQCQENKPANSIAQNNINQMKIQGLEQYPINNHLQSNYNEIMQTKDLERNQKENIDLDQIVKQNDEFNLNDLNKNEQEENDDLRKNKNQARQEQKNFSSYLKSLTKTDSYLEKKQSDILPTQRSIMKCNQSSRKSLFQYTENTPQIQGAMPFSSFGASSRNITKIIQQKYGGAAEQFLEKEFKIIIQREKKIQLNFKYIINQLTCGKFFNSPNVRLIEKAQNLLRDDLDIFNILDRQKELEKMKKLFLSEEQQVLFNFFPKPTISITQDNTIFSMKQIKQEQIDLQKSITKVEKKKRKLNISFKYLATIAKAITKFKKGKKGTISNYQKLFNHYLKLSKENDVNNLEAAMNKKLIELLGDEMRKKFEVAIEMDQKSHENKQVYQLPLSQFFIQRKQSIRENDMNTEIKYQLRKLAQDYYFILQLLKCKMIQVYMFQQVNNLEIRLFEFVGKMCQKDHKIKKIDQSQQKCDKSTKYLHSIRSQCMATFYSILNNNSQVSNLFQKTQVTYVQSVNYSTKPSLLEISSNNFMIAVQYDQQNFIERPMVNITFEQRYYHRFQNGTVAQQKFPYYLEPCTLDHFINLPSYQFNWTESFYKQNITNFLCLQKNQKFYIGGIYENEDFQFIKFSISKCVNSTTNPSNPWNPICEDPDIIKASQNQGSRIRFLISNNILNPEKATGSITSFLDSQIFNVQQSQMYTTANIYLNQQTITTDESIFPIESLHSESLIQFKRSDIQQQNSVGNFGVFCEIFFARSNFSTIAKKSYLKLNQVISYIGGFCQVFFFVSFFL